MARYHFSEEVGEARPCNAKQGNCPVEADSGEEVPHFEGTKKEAQVWAEGYNAARAGGSFNAQKKGSAAQKKGSAESTAVSDEDTVDTALHEREAADKQETLDSLSEEMRENEAIMRHSEDQQERREAKSVHASLASQFNEVDRERARHEVLAQGAPEWAADVGEAFYSEGNTVNRVVSPISATPERDGDQWRMALRLQGARIAYYQDGKLIEGAEAEESEPDAVGVEAKTISGQGAVYVSRRGTSYVATREDASGNTEELSTSRSLESLKKKVHGVLNKNKAVSKENEAVSGDVRKLENRHKRTFEQNRDTEAGYREMLKTQGTVHDPRRINMRSKNTGLTVQNNPRYKMVSSEVEGQSFYVSDGVESYKRPLVVKSVKAQQNYTLKNRHGAVVADRHPSVERNVSDVMSALDKDEGLADGIADTRQKYGERVSDDALDVLAVAREGDKHRGGSGERYQDSYGLGDDAESVQARLRTIADQEPMQEMSAGASAGKSAPSSADNYEVHRHNATAAEHNSLRERAADVLERMR